MKKSKSATTDITIRQVTAANVEEHGIYCIQNRKAPGYSAKIKWFQDKLNNGLQMRIACDSNGKQLGFIEFIPSELAWRPIRAKNFLFIQCIALFGTKNKQLGIGSRLLEECKSAAQSLEKSGICVMTSDGPWMAGRSLFLRNGYHAVDQKDRFDLLTFTLDTSEDLPTFFDWSSEQRKYRGWNLIYSDQCPWHTKSINDLKESADEWGIDLKIKKLTTPEEAQKAPSGFGTYALIKDGKLLEDHYLSRTRFENILKKELGTDPR